MSLCLGEELSEEPCHGWASVCGPPCLLCRCANGGRWVNPCTRVRDSSEIRWERCVFVFWIDGQRRLEGSCGGPLACRSEDGGRWPGEELGGHRRVARAAHSPSELWSSSLCCFSSTLPGAQESNSRCPEWTLILRWESWITWPIHAWPLWERASR